MNTAFVDFNYSETLGYARLEDSDEDGWQDALCSFLEVVQGLTPVRVN